MSVSVHASAGCAHKRDEASVGKVPRHDVGSRTLEGMRRRAMSTCPRRPTPPPRPNAHPTGSPRTRRRGPCWRLAAAQPYQVGLRVRLGGLASLVADDQAAKSVGDAGARRASSAAFARGAFVTTMVSHSRSHRRGRGGRGGRVQRFQASRAGSGTGPLSRRQGAHDRRPWDRRQPHEDVGRWAAG